MTQKITGIIQAIETRNVAGGKVAYNIVVGGESYGAGLYKPKANEGDYVSFDLDDSRGYKNVGRNSLKVSANKPPAEAVEAAKATAPTKHADGSVTTKADEQKQETISRQSALNSAVAFLAVAQAADSLGLPASGTKGKKLEALDTLLAKYTQTFYEQSTGQKWSGTTAKLPEEQAEVVEGEDDAPEDKPWD